MLEQGPVTLGKILMPGCILPDADTLNRDCFCMTLDREALHSNLEREAADLDFAANFVGARQHLFSSTPVFLPRSAVDEMLETVKAIETASRLEGYRDDCCRILTRSSEGPRRSTSSASF